MLNSKILSIVIPSFNSADYIEECLQSLANQACDEVEVLLIDGGSTDRTMEIVNAYSSLFSVIISEKDNGQSHALNKGFRNASGNFITWLNSDDVLCSGSIKLTLTELSSTNYDWLVANQIYIDYNSRVIKCCRSGGFERFFVSKGILHVFGPSTFISRKAYLRLGPFDESLHYNMDMEYWWRMVSSGYTYRRINTYFWGFRIHEMSKTSSTFQGKYSEKHAIESDRLREKFPQLKTLSGFKGRIFIISVKLWRVIKLPYIKAAIDTLRLSGRKIDTAYFTSNDAKSRVSS